MHGCFFALTFDIDDSLLVFDFAKKNIYEDDIKWSLLDNIHLTLVYCYTLDLSLLKDYEPRLPLSLSIKSLTNINHRFLFDFHRNLELLDMQKKIMESIPKNSRLDRSLFYPHITVANNIESDLYVSCNIKIKATKLKLYGSRKTVNDVYPIIKEY